MATVEELLAPISDASPTGEDIRYTPGFDKLKESRRAGGDWLSEGGNIDYLMVVKQCEDILTKKSKDLQVAAWLLDAWLARQGFTGFLSGLQLIQGLIDRYWEGLFPELDEGDAGLRLAPLDWIGSYLDLPLRSVPLSKGGHSLIQYKESQLVGMPPDPEKQYEDPEWENKRKHYAAAVADGKLGGDVFEAGFVKTPKDYYVKLVDELKTIIGTLESLQALCEQKFTDEPPSFNKIRNALDEILITAETLLDEKRKTEPDAVEESAEEVGGAEEETAVEETTTTGTVTVAVKKKSRRAVAGIEPESVDEVPDRLAAIAAFLRTQNPQDPAPYLILRGYRWGELRGSGSTAPDQAMLEEPKGGIRSAIKKLAMDGNWEELIRAGEEAMATPAGRGWLDLQRYIVTACENLYYSAVATAVQSSLRSLLTDMPDMLNMSLMDDTPVANAETQAWIKSYILPPPPEPVAVAESAPPEQYMPTYEPEPVHHDETPGEPREPDAFELAQEALRNGNRDQAIDILVREMGQERSGRGRFNRKMQLAQICLSIGRQVVARPILEELTTEIEKRRLDEWEPTEMVAHTLALLYRCMEGDADRKQQIYAWICRLDPVQAIACLK